MRLYIIRLASIATATLSALKGDRPLAISSELTNSLHLSISGKIVNEAVVFPAPLHPDIMYKYGTFVLLVGDKCNNKFHISDSFFTQKRHFCVKKRFKPSEVPLKKMRFVSFPFLLPNKKNPSDRRKNMKVFFFLVLTLYQVHKFLTRFRLLEKTCEIGSCCQRVLLFHAPHLHAHMLGFNDNHDA